MGITIKGPGKGDLTGTSKKEKNARLASFSSKQNSAVALSKEQQSNGFQGESLNDHGLPDGRKQRQVDGPSYTGPKSREVGQKKDVVGADKYAQGTKGIKTKKGGLNSFIGNEGFKDKESAANYKYKEMDTGEIANRASDIILRGKGTKDEDDEVVRSAAEIEKRNKKKYSTGSKGIKVKGK